MTQMVIVSGMLLSAKGLAAQQGTTTPKRTPEDSARCAAIAAYTASHSDEMKRMGQGMMQLMQSPEVQQAMAKIAQAAIQQVRNGKPGQPVGASGSGGSGNLDFAKLPDTTRHAVALAVRSGQFDSAKALLRPLLGNDSMATLELDFGFKMLALMPDSLRSLLSGTFEHGNMDSMDSCGSVGSVMAFDDKVVIQEVKPLPPPVIRSDSTPPNHP